MLRGWRCREPGTRLRSRCWDRDQGRAGRWWVLRCVRCRTRARLRSRCRGQACLPARQGLGAARLCPLRHRWRFNLCARGLSQRRGRCLRTARRWRLLGLAQSGKPGARFGRWRWRGSLKGNGSGSSLLGRGNRQHGLLQQRRRCPRCRRGFRPRRPHPARSPSPAEQPPEPIPRARQAPARRRLAFCRGLPGPEAARRDPLVDADAETREPRDRGKRLLAHALCAARPGYWLIHGPSTQSHRRSPALGFLAIPVKKALELAVESTNYFEKFNWQ